MQQVENVLVVPRSVLTHAEVRPEGITRFDLNTLTNVPCAFAPRHIVDNKSEESIKYGLSFPQFIGYFVLCNTGGKIFAYRRKGKEEGLLGKWSIGVGGHIDETDRHHPLETPNIVAQRSFERELKEEVNLDRAEQILSNPALISSFADATSTVHVGYTQTLLVDESKLQYDPSEFNEVTWLSVTDLVEFAKQNQFETWSQMLIDLYSSTIDTAHLNYNIGIPHSLPRGIAPHFTPID